MGLSKVIKRCGGGHLSLTHYAPHEICRAHRHDRAQVSLVLAGAYREDSPAGFIEAEDGLLSGKPPGHEHETVFGAAGALDPDDQPGRGPVPRPRMLSLPNDAYVGVYESPALGVMRVTEAGQALEISIGVQRAAAENFTQSESVRVELPPLSGEPVVFELGSDGRPVALVYAGERFMRR